MLLTPNGTPNGMRLEDYCKEEGFTALLIAPVKNESETADETHFLRCLPEEADLWSLYGDKPDGETLLIHDFEVSERGLGHQIVDAMMRLDLPIRYADEARASPLLAKPIDLAEWLTTTIHDEIPGYDDPGDMDTEAFENHPLSELREQMVDSTPYGAASRTFTVHVAANVRAYLDIEVIAPTMHEAVAEIRRMERASLISEFKGSITPTHADPYSIANEAVILDISDDGEVAFDLDIEIPDGEEV